MGMLGGMGIIIHGEGKERCRVHMQDRHKISQRLRKYIFFNPAGTELPIDGS